MIIHIYGASDDLIEIAGDISEEFNPAGDGGYISVQAEEGFIGFDITYDIDGLWLISPIPNEDGPNPDWPMTVKAGANSDVPYSGSYTVVVTVEAPDDAVVKFLDKA